MSICNKCCTLFKVKLLKHEGIQKYFFNTSWLFLEQFLRLLSGFFIGVLVARKLGPSSYGVFSLVLTYFLIFFSISRLGLENVVIKRILSSKEKESKVLMATFYIQALSSLSCVVFLFITTYLFNFSADLKFYICLVSVSLLFRSSDFADYYFKAKVQSKYISVARVFQLLINSSFKIILILKDAQLFWFILTILSEHVLLGILYYSAFRFKKNRIKIKKVELRFIKKLISESFPLMISSTAIIFYSRFDQVLIKYFLDDVAVGNYAASYRLSEAMYLFPTIIAGSLYPALINSKLRSEKEYELRIKRLYSFFIWTTLVIAGAVSYFSQEITTLLFSERFSDAGSILSIQSWNLFFVAIGAVGTRWYLSEGLQHLELLRNIYGAIINIFLNILFIPQFGVVGAAWAALCSFFVSTVLFDLVHPLARKSFYLKLKSINFIKLLSE